MPHLAASLVQADLKPTQQTMTSVPKRFAGFRSARSLLRDPALTDDQKRTALLAWRARLFEGAGMASESGDEELVREINAALREMENSSRHADKE